MDEIKSLAEQIQGKSPGEIRSLIVARFGPNHRDTGSGVSILHWDVGGGVLTFHVLNGVFFTRDGLRKRLLRTTNRVGDCVFGSYGMSTLPNRPRGMCFALGGLALSEEGGYQFEYRPAMPPGPEQEQNFFLHHPAGSAEIEYAPGVTTQTLLENLPAGMVIATVTFTAADGSASQAFSLVVEIARLSFAGEPMPFQLRKGWVNQWS